MAPSSPGYGGTYEFFAMSALSVLDVTRGGALSFALVMHALKFLGSSLLGVACLILTGQSLFGGIASVPREVKG